MHNLKTVIIFEVVRTLKKPSFWLMSLSFPVLFGFLFALMYFSANATNDAAQKLAKESFSIAIVDDSGIIKKDAVADIGAVYASDAQSARKQVQDGTLDAFYHYPKDFANQKVQIYAKNIGVFENGRYATVADQLLARSAQDAIDPSLATAVKGSVSKQVTTYRDGAIYDPLQEALAPGVFLVLFYLLIVAFGNQMLTSTTEEKENRVIEMILTTVRAKTLIVGKIAALIVLGIIQSALVVAPIAIIALVSGGVIQSVAETSPSVAAVATIQDWPLNWMRIGLGLIIFATSFMLFTGLLVTIGAATPTAKEASGFFGAIVLALFGPLYAIPMFVSSPEAVFVKILTFFPLTAPIPLFIRNAVGNLPLIEALIAVGVLILTTMIVIKLAVSVFRKGALQYSRRLKLSEIFR